MSTLGRALAAFGRFWWDFLVGDAPGLAVAVVVVVAAAFALADRRWAAMVALPVLALGAVVVSVARARRRARR